jgi:hypothetical protein
MSAQVTITQLPAAGAITGTEAVPIVQNGQTVQTTTGAISASPSQIYQYLTAIQTPALPNSRYLSGGTGIGLTDSGAQSTFQVFLNGTSGSLESAGSGMIAKSSGIAVPRTFQTSGSGLSISNADGISGNPTFQLTGVAASIAALSGTGVLALTSGGTAVSGRDLTGTANQITVTNGNGSAGNPTFAIATNPALPGSEGVGIPSGTTAERPASPSNGTFRYNSTTGLLEYYSAGTWTALAAGSGVTSIATGTGLTGGPIVSTGTISIANTAVTAGSYGGATKTLTATVNAQGQLTALAETNIAIANTQVSGLGTMSTQDASTVAITGGTINATSVGATTPSTGAFTSVAMTTGTISTTPASANDIVNKSYVDNIVASGITYHAPVYVESPNTTGNLNATYNNGTAGVGATLTNAGTQVALTIDGVLMTISKRVLIYNQTNQAENGVYTVTTVGDGSTNWVLTRATDADTYGLKDPDALGSGDAFFVQAGDTGAGETYVCTTAGVITFGTTAITFAQISSAQVYSAGTGLNLTPATTFNISNTTVTSGSYGGAATVPTYSVNAQGQLTAASNTAIAIAGSQITSGTVAISNGGTGQTSASAGFNALSPITTTGDLIIGNGTNSATRLAIGANTYVLTSDGSTASWQASSGGVTSFSAGTTGFTPSTSTTGAVTLAGTLGIANGGTNSTATPTAGGAIYGTGTAYAITAAGTAGQVLTSAGSSAPVWSGISGGTF